MKTVAVKIELFKLSELSEKARQKAIEKHRHFELSTMSISDFISGEIELDTPEQLQKQYKAEYDYYNENDEPIIENIESNEYLFFNDGKLAKTISYCGKHPKSGTIEFEFMGDIYQV